ncbi:hypothetical protein [Gordonia sp. NB41Y]|uniref:hypothetical protein n=1 Tax=Gordonia sp. NB41Y TaxID=875808 RepID=UPI0002BD7E1E|nr:hypothetical protein [Gordonia sp. NB41Y]WLP91334.1 hypothetical protein Q9K23_03420 [Gordonia sp. NB41Y]
MTTDDEIRSDRDSIVEIAESILDIPEFDEPRFVPFAVKVADQIMSSQWGRDVRDLMYAADHEHAYYHYLAIDDVRCGCCDLRYGEREQYGCCSQYGIHDHSHEYAPDALRAARLCRDDCPRWWARPKDLDERADEERASLQHGLSTGILTSLVPPCPEGEGEGTTDTPATPVPPHREGERERP